MPLSTTFERKRVVVVTRTRSHGLVTVTHLGSSRNHPPNEPSPLLTLTSHSSSLLAERLSVGSTADESPSLFSPHFRQRLHAVSSLTSFRELTVKPQRLDYLPHDYTVENILTKRHSKNAVVESNHLARNISRENTVNRKLLDGILKRIKERSIYNHRHGIRPPSVAAKMEGSSTRRFVGMLRSLYSGFS